MQIPSQPPPGSPYLPAVVGLYDRHSVWSIAPVPRISSKGGLKKPRESAGLFHICSCRAQAQLGVNVEPLGDELGPIVLPEGFIVVLDPLAESGVVPVVLPLPLMVFSAAASHGS
jgi:hypothetical protein